VTPLLRTIAAEEVALAVAVNSCAGVVASSAALLFAMRFGFSLTLVAAAGVFWAGLSVWRDSVGP
jgi:hypothetical protein